MAKPLSLLNSSSEEESDNELKVNKSYADRYNVWRNKEEMQKLKDLSKDISDSSSESEEEEEPIIEKDFFRVLSCIKSKDPRIYDQNYKWFAEEQAVAKKAKVKKDKPMFMKDYERKLVLERNGVFSDDDDDEHIPEGPSLVEEQEEIKKSFKEAVGDSDADDDGDELFKVRTKTKDEKDKEEADYKEWLKEEDMKYLNKEWNDPNLDEDEKFLRDYILEKKYMFNDKSEIPTYDQITGDIDILSEDENAVEQQEVFERKFNFRYEEPDEEFIKNYPRTVGDSLRRQDNRRKKKREEYAERKKKEKEQKTEELKRLKALKRKEIEEKFLKLKEASGKDELNLDESDIESDFDPEKHDQKMKEMFNDDYYGVEEEQKPEFSFEEDIDDEDWDHWTREKLNNAQLNRRKGKVQSEEMEGSSESENDPEHDAKSQFAQEMIDFTSTKKRKGRKKSLFAKIVSEPKPLYDPDGKSFDEYLDEYYKLDYEDIVGDMPVRFKYRKVIPNDFGLTVDEILAAHDKELNRWCSVKKTCQYRKDEEEKYDVQAFQKKAQNFEVKKKILTSVYSKPEETEEEHINANSSEENESVAKPKRKKKKSKKKKAAENANAVEDESNVKEAITFEPSVSNESSGFIVTDNQESKRKKKKKKKAKVSDENGKMSSNLYSEVNGLSKKDMSENTQRTDQSLPEMAEIEIHQNDGMEKNTKKKKKLKLEKDLLSNDAVNEETKDDGRIIEVKQNNTKKLKKLKSLDDMNSFSTLPHTEESNCEDAETEENENHVKKNKKKRKKQNRVDDANSLSSVSAIEESNCDVKNTEEGNDIMNIKKKGMKRKRDSLNDDHSFSVSSQNEEPDPDDTKMERSENEKLHNSPAKKRKKLAKNKDRKLNSFSNQSTKQNFRNSFPNKGNHFMNDSNVSNKKGEHKRFSNKQQSFGKPYLHKQNFRAQNFYSNSKAPNNNSEEMILNSSGKQIVSSNTRLGAFQINPKKFKNSMIYNNKKQM